jgi:hypothetical protein
MNHMQVEADGWTIKGGFTQALFPGRNIPLPTKITAYVMTTDTQVEFDVNECGQVRIPNWAHVRHVAFVKKDDRILFFPVRSE